MIADKKKELLAMQGKFGTKTHFDLDEVDKVYAELPQWTSVRLIMKEVKERFGECDKADLNARLELCQAFEIRWEPTRRDYT